MAHEIDETVGAGEDAAMLSVGETPWHRLGKVLKNAPSVPEALKLSKLDWQVTTEPVYFRRELEGGDEVWVDIPGARVTVRNDTFRPLGTVTEKYQPLQNQDGFAILEPLIDEGLATIETCGALREGRDVWLLVLFNLAAMAKKKSDKLIAKVFEKDPVKPYGLLANNHAGTRAVTLQETPVRVVCANTLAMAHSEGADGGIVSIRHTTNVEAKVVEAAREMWGGIIDRYRVTAEAYDQLQKRYLKEAEFRTMVLDVIAPLPKEVKTNGQKAKETRAKRVRDAVTAKWEEGTGHKGNGTAWEAYQSVCQLADHSNTFGKSRTTDSRMESLQAGGRLHFLKELTMDSLLGYEVEPVDESEVAAV